METIRKDARAWLADHAPEWDEAGQQALALAAELSDAQVARLVPVLLAFDTWAGAKATDREEQLWAAIEIHTPGFAPLWEVLRAHLQYGAKPECTDPRDELRCALAASVGWQG